MPSRAAADYADSVEPIVRKTAAWAWRLLVILVALITLLWVIKRLEIIVVPLLLALILSALLVPIVDWLDRRGAPRGREVQRCSQSSDAAPDDDVIRVHSRNAHFYDVNRRWEPARANFSWLVAESERCEPFACFYHSVRWSPAPQRRAPKRAAIR